jgi:3-oxoacyl-[acyl-carrier-protein] synthase II
MSLYLSDWNVVSPLGIGKEAFSRGAAAAAAGLPAAAVAQPMQPLVFQDFDKKIYLGKKGVRNLDTLCAYATVASYQLVQGCADGWVHDPAEKARTGVVLGTGSGSVRSQLDFICELHRQEQVEWVDPVQFPQTVMNCAAGQVGIWHGFTGVNVTVSGGYQSGVTALQYAHNLLRHGRVDRVLAGCVEEFSAYSSFQLPLDSRELRRADRLGEGCAMFLAAAQPRHADDVEVLVAERNTQCRRGTREQMVEALLQTVRSRLAARFAALAAAVPIARICCNRLSSADSADARREDQLVDALRRGLSQAQQATLLCSNDVLADCLAATTGLQIGLVFSLGKPARVPACDLVLTFDPLGAVGLVLLAYVDDAAQDGARSSKIGEQ